MSILYDNRLPKRFWDNIKVCENTRCWEWLGAKSPGGYGRFSWKGKCTVSHRVAYVALVGEVPKGLELDHLCRNRSCCNPQHLEPVSRSENVRRGDLVKVTLERHAAITHCPKGHEYTEENTYRHRNARYCRKCHADRERERRHRARKNCPHE